MHSFDQTPDRPQPFGFKVNWLALKTSDPLAVVDALDLKETTPANWESGLAVVYGYDPWIFVSPPVGGWVLAVGVSLPYSHSRNSTRYRAQIRCDVFALDESIY